jgi:hypothetical protein
MTAADILFRTAQFMSSIDEPDCTYIVHSIWFDEVARETQFIPFSVPDMFLADVQAALKCGWRPVAIEANEDDEAEEYACIALEYLGEPSLEDEAIIESMFAVSD